MDNLFVKWWARIIGFLLGCQLYALIAFALILGGCTPQPPEKLPEGVIRVDTGLNYVRIQEIRLADETRCVVAANRRGSAIAISCEWQPDIVLKQ